MNSTKHLIIILIIFPEDRAINENSKPKIMLNNKDKNDISKVIREALSTLGNIYSMKSISNIYFIKSILRDLL